MRSRLIRALTVCVVFSGFLIHRADHVRAVSSGVVISQVYGGGGNANATHQNDFIELFNRGTAPVSLSGWSLQYASATGTGNFGANATQITELPAVTLNPGQYFLVQEAGGAVGALLPTADHVDPTAINMSGTAGKVALVSAATSLNCNGSFDCLLAYGAGKHRRPDWIWERQLLREARHPRRR